MLLLKKVEIDVLFLIIAITYYLDAKYMLLIKKCFCKPGIIYTVYRAPYLLCSLSLSQGGVKMQYNFC